MRVCLVCPYSLDHPGGVATHVLGLARWLRRNGAEAEVLAPGTGTVHTDVPLRLLGRSVPLPFNGSVAHLGLSPAQAAKAREISAGYDLVHVHEPLTPGLAYACARSADRLVVTHHASFEPGRALLRLLRARAARLPDRVTLAVSQAAARLVGDITGDAPHLVPNAIVLPERSDAPQTVPPMVVFVGRIREPRKGYEVFADVARLVPEARFVAVGQGGRGAGGVEELGLLDDPALGRVLDGARVLMAPNLYGESFGIVLIEGLAHGAAVVASDLAAFRDVVDDPAVATFFPAGDAMAAAETLRARLSAPHDRDKARQVAERYSWDSVGPQVLEAYRRAG